MSRLVLTAFILGAFGFSACANAQESSAFLFGQLSGKNRRALVSAPVVQGRLETALQKLKAHKI